MKVKLKPALVSLLAISILATSTPAQAGNDTSWIPKDSNYWDPTVHSFAFADNLPLPFQYSVLQGDSFPDIFICKSTSDPFCAQSQILNYNSILKVCSTSADTNCVAEVSSIDAAGNPNPGKFFKYTVNNHLNSFPADPVAGIPAGDMPSIWSIPSAPHASGSDYAIVAGLNGNVDRSGHETVIGNFMQLSLIPVVLKDFGKGKNSQDGGWTAPLPGIYYDYCTEFQQTDHNKNVNCGHVNGESCLFPTNDQGMCYAEEAFGDSQRFNVKVKLAKEPTGWMHGRMVDPVISITPGSAGGVNLSVTAGATAVPMLYQTAAWASLPSSVQNLWVDCFKDQRFCGWSVTRGSGATSAFNELGQTLEGNAKVNLLTFVHAFGTLPLKVMSAVAPLVGDKSNLLSSTWSMRTLSNMEMNGSNKCFTNTPGLKGIVTTNSTAYSAGPPEFKDGSLNYQVSSPHFSPDGKTPFKGNYNLVMRSDVARCIYGFSNAPIKASISVLSSDGNNDVSTTVAAEKDGWLSLSANNFQFSAPIIQVKLSQDKPAVVTQSTAVAPKVSNKQVTVTCIKGKTSKKVTAAKPVCPKGYVKK